MRAPVVSGAKREKRGGMRAAGLQGLGRFPGPRVGGKEKEHAWGEGSWVSAWIPGAFSFFFFPIFFPKPFPKRVLNSHQKQA